MAVTPPVLFLLNEAMQHHAGHLLRLQRLYYEAHVSIIPAGIGRVGSTTSNASEVMAGKSLPPGCVWPLPPALRSCQQASNTI